VDDLTAQVKLVKGVKRYSLGGSPVSIAKDFAHGRFPAQKLGSA